MTLRAALIAGQPTFQLLRVDRTGIGELEVDLPAGDVVAVQVLVNTLIPALEDFLQRNVSRTLAPRVAQDMIAIFEGVLSNFSGIGFQIPGPNFGEGGFVILDLSSPEVSSFNINRERIKLGFSTLAATDRPPSTERPRGSRYRRSMR